MDKIEKLKQLKKLFDDGMLSEDEFIMMKKELVLNEEIIEKDNSNDVFKSVENTGNEELNKTNSVKENSQSEPSENQQTVTQKINKKVEPHAKSNSNKSIFYVVVGIIVLLLFLFKPFYEDMFKKKKVEYDAVKTMSDLESFVTQRADGWCEQWHKACEYSNSHKRWEEQLYVDGYVNDFVYTSIPDVVKDNDLPDDYVTKARELFEKKMNECGWFYDRSKWPGRESETITNDNTYSNIDNNSGSAESTQNDDINQNEGISDENSINDVAPPNVNENNVTNENTNTELKATKLELGQRYSVSYGTLGYTTEGNIIKLDGTRAHGTIVMTGWYYGNFNEANRRITGINARLPSRAEMQVILKVYKEKKYVQREEEGVKDLYWTNEIVDLENEEPSTRKYYIVSPSGKYSTSDENNNIKFFMLVDF